MVARVVPQSARRRHAESRKPDLRGVVARPKAPVLEAKLTPLVLSDSHDRSILDLRIAICHTCSDRPILDLRMACGAQRVLVDLLNAALCPERV